MNTSRRRSIVHRIIFIAVFVCATLIPAAASVAEVTLIGGLINIPAAGPFAPAVAYNAASNQYLVLWRDVTDPFGWESKAVRVDADTGAVLDSPFYISDDPSTLSAVTPAVTYNSANGEWFVVYQASQASVDSGRDDVFGQRIASDGSKVGGHIELVRKSYWQNSAEVAHDPTRNRYLVVWSHGQGTGTQKVIQGRLFDATGSPISPEIPISDASLRNKHFPKVAYNPVMDEFMVAWSDYRNLPPDWDPDVHGNDNKWMDIYGQRIGTDGTALGANIPLYVPADPVNSPNGQDAINGIACSTTDGRYAIGVTKLTAAEGWTTVGFVINADGSMVASVFNLSRPNFGAQARPAYNPTDGTYFISYEGPSNNVAGKQISASGNVISGEETIISSIGGIRDNALAVRGPVGGSSYRWPSATAAFASASASTWAWTRSRPDR